MKKPNQSVVTDDWVNEKGKSFLRTPPQDLSSCASLKFRITKIRFFLNLTSFYGTIRPG